MEDGCLAESCGALSHVWLDRSRVEDDKHTENLELPSHFPNVSVDQTDAPTSNTCTRDLPVTTPECFQTLGSHKVRHYLRRMWVRDRHTPSTLKHKQNPAKAARAGRVLPTWRTGPPPAG